jgi:hypothetical protein
VQKYRDKNHIINSKSLLGRTVSGEGRGFQLNKTDSFVNLQYGTKKEE